jgi:hypothetical protein
MSRVLKPKPAPLAVGELLPAACDAHDLARAFGKSLQTMYDWHRDGRLRRFELPKPMTSRRWSGKLIMRFLEESRHGAVALRQVS